MILNNTPHTTVDPLEFLLETLSDLADVTFLVEGIEIKAHKAILSSHSTVFEALFDCEDPEDGEAPIEMVDIKVEVFKELLRYLYTEKVNSLERYAEELYIAADLFKVESLKCLCLTALPLVI